MDGAFFETVIFIQIQDGNYSQCQANLFYGFVVDGPSAVYEKVKKFSASWGTSVSWKPTYVGVVLGLDQFYRSYSIPSGYEIDYPQKSAFTEFKASVLWDI